MPFERSGDQLFLLALQLMFQKGICWPGTLQEGGRQEQLLPQRAHGGIKPCMEGLEWGTELGNRSLSTGRKYTGVSVCGHAGHLAQSQNSRQVSCSSVAT